MTGSVAVYGPELMLTAHTLDDSVANVVVDARLGGLQRLISHSVRTIQCPIYSRPGAVLQFEIWGDTTGGPTITWEATSATFNISSVVPVASTRFSQFTVTTTAPHGYRVGDTVVIGGVLLATSATNGWNYSWHTVQTVPSATTFTIGLIETYPTTDLTITSGFPTRSGSTATVRTTSAHGLSGGDSVVVAGCIPKGYNGTYAVAVVDATNFTYTVGGSPVTPATTSGQVTKGASADINTGTTYRPGFALAAAWVDPGANAVRTLRMMLSGLERPAGSTVQRKWIEVGRA